MKLNHNETLSYPTEYDQTLYASVEQAFNMGAVAVGATIYFGSEQSRRQIEEISAAFERAHELGRSPCCGPICAIRRSRKTASTIMFPLT